MGTELPGGRLHQCRLPGRHRPVAGRAVVAGRLLGAAGGLSHLVGGGGRGGPAPSRARAGARVRPASLLRHGGGGGGELHAGRDAHRRAVRAGAPRRRGRLVPRVLFGGLCAGPRDGRVGRRLRRAGARRSGRSPSARSSASRSRRPSSAVGFPRRRRRFRRRASASTPGSAAIAPASSWWRATCFTPGSCSACGPGRPRSWRRCSLPTARRRSGRRGWGPGSPRCFTSWASPRAARAGGCPTAGAAPR